MPAREQHADRLAVEAQLTTAELRSLHEVCRAAGVPHDSWHRCDAIARYVETLAHGRITTQLQDEGASEFVAVSTAAVRLGLNVDTVLARRRRWRSSAA